MMTNFAQYQNEMNISCHGLTIFSKTFVKYIKCNINYLHPFDVPMKSFSRFMAALMVNENSSMSCFMFMTFLGWKGSLKRFVLNNVHLNLEKKIRRVWNHNNYFNFESLILSRNCKNNICNNGSKILRYKYKNIVRCDI